MNTKIWINSVIQCIVILGVGIGLHVLNGNSVEAMIADVKTMFSLLGGGLCLLGLFVSVKLLYFVIKNRHIYDRNHHATKVCRKVMQGTATPQEQAEYEKYCDSGVITFNGSGLPRVSDDALDEQLQ